MKVRIKTAHGYLSFQPDGRLEYRPAVGPWEEIDIEGLELTPRCTCIESESESRREPGVQPPCRRPHPRPASSPR